MQHCSAALFIAAEPLGKKVCWGSTAFVTIWPVSNEQEMFLETLILSICYSKPAMLDQWFENVQAKMTVAKLNNNLLEAAIA